MWVKEGKLKKARVISSYGDRRLLTQNPAVVGVALALSKNLFL